MQDIQLSATEWNVYLLFSPHLIESFPIGLNWGMRTNGYFFLLLMLLSLVMSSDTCWECSNLPARSPPLQSQTTSHMTVLTAPAWLDLTRPTAAWILNTTSGNHRLPFYSSFYFIFLSEWAMNLEEYNKKNNNCHKVPGTQLISWQECFFNIKSNKLTGTKNTIIKSWQKTLKPL